MKAMMMIFLLISNVQAKDENVPTNILFDKGGHETGGGNIDEPNAYRIINDQIVPMIQALEMEISDNAELGLNDGLRDMGKMNSKDLLDLITNRALYIRVTSEDVRDYKGEKRSAVNYPLGEVTEEVIRNYKLPDNVKDKALILINAELFSKLMPKGSSIQELLIHELYGLLKAGDDFDYFYSRNVMANYDQVNSGRRWELHRGDRVKLGAASLIWDFWQPTRNFGSYRSCLLSAQDFLKSFSLSLPSEQIKEKFKITRKSESDQAFVFTEAKQACHRVNTKLN